MRRTRQCIDRGIINDSLVLQEGLPFFSVIKVVTLLRVDKLGVQTHLKIAPVLLHSLIYPASN